MNKIDEFNKTCDVAICSLKLRDKTNATTIKMVEELRALANKAFDELKVGTVTINKAYFSNYIGEISGKTNAGREVKADLKTSAVQSFPIIGYKNKHFVLTWGDIVNLAENAGLFEEETDK